SFLNQNLLHSNRFEPRWLNYYGPPQNLLGVNLDQALADKALPADYFRSKVVIVGGRPDPGLVGTQQDEFSNPFTRLWGFRTPGAAIHAFSLLNLLRDDWLRRLDVKTEICIVVAWGIAASILFMRLSPWPAIGAAMLTSFA